MSLQGLADAAAIGTAVAEPEIGVPLLVVTHPGKSLGAVLIAWSVVLVIVGIMMTIVGFTRTFGKLILAGGVMMGVVGAYIAFHHKKKKQAQPKAA